MKPPLLAGMIVLMALSSCFAPYEGPTSVTREFQVHEDDLFVAIGNYCDSQEVALTNVSDGVRRIKGRYEFEDAGTWGSAAALLGDFAEPMGSFINSYGKSPFVDLTFLVKHLEVDRSSLEMTSRFKTWGEPTGRGGVGPFPMNSKGVWEKEFLDQFDPTEWLEDNRPRQSTIPPRQSTISGTGFLVTSDGLILTAYHVIEGASSIRVQFVDGRQFDAQVEARSSSTDLAVLRINGTDLEPLTLIPRGGAKQGQRVFTLGYPAAGILGQEPKYSEGAISALSGFGDEASLMQISVPIQPGNSGGPVVSESGEVVGIVTSTAALSAFLRHTGTLPQNVNWAVKSEYARLLLPALSEEIDPGNRGDVVEATRRAVCLITVLRD